MAPNKFEKHIKNQLQERDILPSASAWEALSEKLDEIAPQPKKKGYFWYGIAASLIGLLILSVVHFNDELLTNNQGVQVVDAEKEEIEVITEQEIDIENAVEKDAVVESVKKEQAPASEVQTVIKSQSVELNNQVASVNEAVMVVESPVKKAKIVNGLTEEIINNKILEIVATVDSLEQNTDALTKVEVNELLRNAQDELLKDRLFDKNGSVDAIALLTEVENELDQSFRDQIFESLKTGFLKVRTAVADRNK